MSFAIRRSFVPAPIHTRKDLEPDCASLVHRALPYILQAQQHSEPYLLQPSNAVTAASLQDLRCRVNL